MKRYLFLLSVFLCMGFLFAQDKIPRRIVFDIIADGNSKEVVFMLPDILNARINDIQTIIPVGKNQKFHNIIVIHVKENIITFILYKDSTIIDERDFILEIINLPSLEKICTELSILWTPYLGLAEPFIEDVLVLKRNELSYEALFEESMATEFQVSAWLTLFRNSMDLSEGNLVYDFLFPQIIDLDWYFNTSWGFNFSFYVEASKFISFGRTEIPDTSWETANSFNVLLLPGFGLTFRSLGKISGNYGVSLYMGPVYVDAIDDIMNSSPVSISTFLSAGESKWILFSFLSLKTGISYNFNKQWSLKTRIVTFISPLVFIDPFQQLTEYSSMERGSAFSVNLQLGLGYRW